ncbi:MAG: holo-ACP synthase [Rhodobacteraceae bacterium]|nr:holo-ACP synthase [Paracoccaceae bacterium]
MISGIGTDLININRIARLLDRFGDRFRMRVFTLEEREKARQHPDEAATLAKRWAAKEACAKALGTGIGSGLRWRDISVGALPTGQPTLTLRGQARQRLQAQTPPQHASVLHLTLSDDPPWAHAFVLIEARPWAPASA